jgi:uncharacterized protein (TIGR00299 family) protein
MSTLFLDPVGGLAGDMITACLLDLGAPMQAIESAIGSLPVSGITVHTEDCMRGPFAAKRFIVEAEAQAHQHRTWHDIQSMLQAAELQPAVRSRALKVFEALAGAEATVHGMAIGDVHFHEVGAWDSIADIVGACAALEALSIDRIICGPPPLGSGTTQSAHGTMPLPAPATAALLTGWPVRPGLPGKESTTPTGAAIVVALGQPGSIPPMVLRGTGIGAGTRNPAETPNIVRALLGDEATSESTPAQVIEISAQMDDMSGEHLPPLIEALLQAGALDAFAQQIVMKKGRTGLLLTALSHPESAAAVQQAMLKHGTTFGLRYRASDRIVLARWHDTVSTPWGDVRVKVGALDGEVLHAAPEYEDVYQVARAADQSTVQVHTAALSAWRKTQEKP